MYSTDRTSQINQGHQKKILILALSGIGNLLMQSPVFATIKKAHPDWHITLWVAPRGTRALAQQDSHIDEIIEASHQNSLSGHLRLIQQLRARKFDIGIVLSPGQLLKSAAYLFFTGIPRRIGNSYPLRSNPHSSFLLTDAIPENPELHDIEQNLQLLTPLKIPLPTTKIPYTLSLPILAQQKASEVLSSYNLAGHDKKLIGIHAGSAPDFLWKRWPLENFAEVAKVLIEKHHAHILLFGGPDEKSQNETLKSLINQEAVSVVQADLITTAAIIRHCKIVLSNDSGLMHIASAVGIETFGMFGPTNETHTGPRGPKSHVIRAPGTKPIYNTELNYSLGKEPHASILAITPAYVVSKLEGYIA